MDLEGADASLSIKFGIMKPVIALDMELAALKYLQDLFPKSPEFPGFPGEELKVYMHDVYLDSLKYGSLL